MGLVRWECSREVLIAAIISKIITRGRGRGRGGKTKREKGCVASFGWRSEEEKKEKAETKEQVRKDRTEPGWAANVRERSGGGGGAKMSARGRWLRGAGRRRGRGV